ncbi:YecH family protein [Pelagicoccus albus]|uniref:YecH family protein n=2 Tax=Pelagicoccus albus TaxID=415222 RepID=A0A7X1E9B8_9BACT|nr:YecH family protein [Pelagicoccus albus]
MSQFSNLQKPDIHAHEILDMMESSGKTYSNESLSKEIAETFGEESTFNTCSAQGMDCKVIVDHLWEKGKFSGTTEAFVYSPGSRCDH